MQSIVGGSQPTVSRRPIKHESSGFSFLLHLLPNACHPTNLPVISLALIIDLHTYRVITNINVVFESEREREREISFAFVSYSCAQHLYIDCRQSKEQMCEIFSRVLTVIGIKIYIFDSIFITN